MAPTDHNLRLFHTHVVAPLADAAAPLAPRTAAVAAPLADAAAPLAPHTAADAAAPLAPHTAADAPAPLAPRTAADAPAPLAPRTAAVAAPLADAAASRTVCEKKRQQLARVCDLVADSLLPHLVSNVGRSYLVTAASQLASHAAFAVRPPLQEPESLATRRPQLSREEERCVLLVLSRVNKAIRGWDHDKVDDGEQGCASDQVLLRISVAYVLVPFDLFRVLHIILKLLKLNDSELKDEFICLSIYHIQKLHWDPGYQFNAGKVVSLVTDDRHSLSKDSAQFGIVSGSLLQLLCSLVEQSDMEDMDRRDVFVKLADVIPRLATYLQEQQHIPKSLSQYSKHKILMLMIRLKPHIQQNCSHIVCFLLHEPMFQHSTKLENCLEGSPFLLSGVGLGELQDKSTRHLQRQAMYLFLSCPIFLACSGNDSRLNCSCKRDHKGQDFGLSQISVWFERCCLDEILDSKSSTDIVLCFLQLYMEELHYDDHLVLVDYLIAKDVGVHCAQYLLRCLRLVSRCWDAFVDDSVYEAQIQKLNCKRQRIFKNINSFTGSSMEGTKKEPLFRSAKVCLLSLKRTLEDLHKKNLFPYNPKPLLKSLARFEELCLQY
ncbi:hypothetical protein ZWY2020_032041 [Hordeum vulgare]|nr:hypothetical protein ZWY2020_032041 [Hordeum vulgare]